VKKIIVLVAVLGCLCVALAVFMRQNGRWQTKQEQRATEDFYKNQTAYGELLDRWTTLYPNRCGGPAPAPGLVADQSIIATSGDTYSLDVNGQTSSKLALTDVAARLGVPPLEVSSVTELLRMVKSDEIIQSGAAVKIISPQNDTHGVLHVAPTCSEAVSYESWSNASNGAGPYRRLKALGGGWYYYVEER
jgi:hypothetical protein